jgi:hypothetical protein
MMQGFIQVKTSIGELRAFRLRFPMANYQDSQSHLQMKGAAQIQTSPEVFLAARIRYNAILHEVISGRKRSTRAK